MYTYMKSSHCTLQIYAIIFVNYTSMTLEKQKFRMGAVTVLGHISHRTLRPSQEEQGDSLPHVGHPSLGGG